MKKAVSTEQAGRLINPGCLIMVSSAEGGRKNISAIAWHMPLSSDPHLAAIAVAKKHFTSELIMISEEFTINVPSWPLLDKAIFCGNVSGRDKDKFTESGLTAEPPIKLAESPRIKECIGAVECDLYETKETGDHYLFIGQPVYAEAEEELFTDSVWVPEKAALIFHLGGKHFLKSGQGIILD